MILSLLAIFMLRSALVLRKPLLDRKVLESHSADKIVLEATHFSHYVEKVSKAQK